MGEDLSWNCLIAHWKHWVIFTIALLYSEFLGALNAVAVTFENQDSITHFGHFPQFLEASLVKSKHHVTSPRGLIKSWDQRDFNEIPERSQRGLNQLLFIGHEFHETCHSVTVYFMKKDSKWSCDTTTPESIHTKDESKRGSAFAFIFGVNWPVQWM